MYRKNYWIIVLLSLTIFCCTDELQSADSSISAPRTGFLVQETLYKAQKEYEKGHFDNAEQILQNHLTENPEKDHYLLRFMFGNILAAQRENQKAIIQYNLSASLYPGYSYTWLNMGKLYYEGGLFGPAADAFIKGYNLSDQKDHSLKYHAAVCFLLAKDYTIAIKLLEDLSVTHAPEQKWIEALISAYLESDMPQKALNILSRLIDKSESLSYLWKLRAQILLHQKKYDLALQALLIYSYDNNLSSDEKMLVGNLFNVINAPSAAADYYLSSINQDQKQFSISNAERLAVTYLAAHEPDRAMSFLVKAVQEIHSAKLWLLLGKILYDKGFYYDSGQAFRKSGEIDPMDGQSHLMHAYCMIKLNDFDASTVSLRQVMNFPRHKNTAKKLLDSIQTHY